MISGAINNCDTDLLIVRDQTSRLSIYSPEVITQKILYTFCILVVAFLSKWYVYVCVFSSKLCLQG